MRFATKAQTRTNQQWMISKSLRTHGLIRLVLSGLLGAWVLLSASSSWAEMKSVRPAKVNFRQAPAAEAAVLFTAEKYYPVQVLVRQRGWAKIRDFEGEIAWIAERLLDNTKTVVIVAKGVFARKAPDPTAEKDFELPWSNAYVIAQKKDNWVQVKTQDNRSGWVHENYVWGHK